MILEDDFSRMRLAKTVAGQSNCKRRKIGVVIPLTGDEYYKTFLGANYTPTSEFCCGREGEICTAIHAEVMAIQHVEWRSFDVTDLYIWAEVPCHSCLSYIKRFSTINRIVCLMPETYAVEYPRILNRLDEIKERLTYARALNLDVVQLDREEILSDELSSSASNPQQH